MPELEQKHPLVSARNSEMFGPTVHRMSNRRKILPSRLRWANVVNKYQKYLMVYDIAKNIIKKPLHLMGLDLVRRRHSGPDPAPSRALPPIREHPVTALYQDAPDARCTFSCPLDRCVTVYGWNYGSSGWHPFVETLLEYRANKRRTYRGSFLELYYHAWTPQSAGDVVLAKHIAPSTLEAYSPQAFVVPWDTNDIETERQRADTYMQRENEQAGYPDVGPEEGYNHFGPVSSAKGHIEYNRLSAVYTSIDQNGYQRGLDWDGDIRGWLLRRGSEYRFLLRSGFHRLAAAAALGYSTIPARIVHPVLVDPSNVHHWPQVQRGVWSCEHAVAYFNYLFDFNSRAWARKNELLFNT